MKIVSIVGARPQFIKLSTLSKELRKYYHERILHTGQHYDPNMSDIILKDLGIPVPDYNLNIGSGVHGEQTGKMLIGIEEILLKEKPGLVIVFGDTNSTLAGSLAASKLHIPLIHIEAGLRSFNRRMPEEINRLITDHVSNYLFAPTNTAMINLYKEGLSNNAILTGDIMVDSLNRNLRKAVETSDIDKKLHDIKSFYLLTLHRPYNVDSVPNLQLIFKNLSLLNKHIVFPIHPRTKNIILSNKLNIPKNIIELQPLSYFDFLKVEYLADKIITDSGGIQKEAYILKKPCITLRTETEWIETVEHGWNILVNINDSDFINKIESFKPDKKQRNVFGTKVTDKMVSHIRKIFTQ